MTTSAPLSDRGDEPASDVVATGTAVRADVVRLVRERRYEEALTALYAARADAPDNKELAASIRQIKEFLVGSYAKKLGGLDRVAGPVPIGGARFPDALLVARYVDGVSTFDDIRRTCPLGQLRTLQVLVALYAGAESVPSLVTTPPPPAVRPREPSPRPSWERSREKDEPPPDTKRARTGDSAPPAVVAAVSVAPSPDDALFKQAFARGTAAFVQRRYADAIDAFRECERLRPTDAATATMLRRALRDAERG